MKQDQFLDVLDPDAARDRWHGALDLAPRPAETVPLAEALGRVLAVDVRAPGNVPAFDRSNVDGFAVRAEDTFGADERQPARLRLVGEPIPAGHAPTGEVGSGEARVIATGGVIPRGADAVVMVEDTRLDDEGRVEVVRPVVPGGRISAAGSDVTQGETLLWRGTRLSARETGTLAACGVDRVECVRRVRVGILSTGDEIVPPGTPLVPGHVHDANATLLADAVRELGGKPHLLGIVPDDEARLGAVLAEALGAYDALLLSGGTSKGGGDVSYRLLADLAQIVVHGVALKPGKPLCLAAYEARPVVVLPGFPTSAIFTFHAFVAPVLRRLQGLGERGATTVKARLPRHVQSEAGRREFTLVSLVPGPSGLTAFPLGKGSGSVTTFARADGFYDVPAASEYVEAGETVDVTLLGRSLEPADLVVVGSHCTGLDVILSFVVAEGLEPKVLTVGSRGGLDAARQGACDVAPVHLYDRATGRYNEPFVEEGMTLVEGYGRRQGLAYRPELESALGPSGDGEGAAEALRRACRSGAWRIANRNPASGTRALVDDLLDGTDATPPGWATTYRSHHAVAAAIEQGRADFGVCLDTAARERGLAWRPLKDERYDFLIPSARAGGPGATAFRRALDDPGVRRALRARGFDA